MSAVKIRELPDRTRTYFTIRFFSSIEIIYCNDSNSLRIKHVSRKNETPNIPSTYYEERIKYICMYFDITHQISWNKNIYMAPNKTCQHLLNLSPQFIPNILALSKHF